MTATLPLTPPQPSRLYFPCTQPRKKFTMPLSGLQIHSWEGNGWLCSEASTLESTHLGVYLPFSETLPLKSFI